MEELTFYVPSCNTNVTLVPIGSMYKVEPPIWHPAVHYPLFLIYGKDVDALVDIEKAFKSPFNLDALAQYKKDRNKFDDMNKKLRNMFDKVSKNECCVCLEDSYEKIRFTCHRLHFVCLKCDTKIKICPMCRFEPLPMKK